MDAAVSAELEQIWSHVQAKLAAAVDEPTYRVWLEPLCIRSLSSNSLAVEAPPRACEWIRERFGRLLEACAAAVLEQEIAVDILEAGEHTGGRGPYSSESSTPAHPPDSPRQPPPAARNPRFTFNQFVIGDSNRLAHAAALAVAEMPGQAYNPLFICGPPGVGKTHLLHSIASLIAQHDPGLTVRTATGESFTNEFQLALGQKQMNGFKARYRQAGVLLVDDVQFLERKTRTEEEFFHTFNELYEAGAQIVLTSDRPPRDLQALEDRLRERFEAGLVADIQPPDSKTRLAILRKRAQHDGITPADDTALSVIANRVTVNVRALEGALVRVVACGSLTGRPLTGELASEVLGDLHPPSTQTSRTVAEIQAAACEHFELSSEELLSSTRTTRIAWPRQVAMYLTRELTGQSLPAIGRHFGGRDHTTVLHACRRTEERILSNPASKQAVDALRQRLQHPALDRDT
jgi:chromosomal replication initiator protein